MSTIVDSMRTFRQSLFTSPSILPPPPPAQVEAASRVWGFWSRRAENHDEKPKTIARDSYEARKTASKVSTDPLIRMLADGQDTNNKLLKNQETINQSLTTLLHRQDQRITSVETDVNHLKQQVSGMVETEKAAHQVTKQELSKEKIAHTATKAELAVEKTEHTATKGKLVAEIKAHCVTQRTLAQKMSDLQNIANLRHFHIPKVGTVYHTSVKHYLPPQTHAPLTMPSGMSAGAAAATIGALTASGVPMQTSTHAPAHSCTDFSRITRTGGAS